MYPFRASSTEFRMYTPPGLDGSVLIGGGRSACTGRTSILNGCSRDSLGSRGSSSGTSLPGVPRMLLKKTGSAAFSRGHRLTVLHTTQPASTQTTNSSEPSLMPKKIQSRNVSVIWIFFLLASKNKVFSFQAAGMALGSALSTRQAWLSDETCTEMHVGMQ